MGITVSAPALLGGPLTEERQECQRGGCEEITYHINYTSIKNNFKGSQLPVMRASSQQESGGFVLDPKEMNSACPQMGVEGPQVQMGMQPG